MKFFKKITKKDKNTLSNSKDAAKERLHLVLMQDRANVSADFLELMKQEIIEVIKKYIDVDEAAIDVRLTNKENEDGTNGAPALYANIPILNIKSEARKLDSKSENGEKTEDLKKLENDEVVEEKKQQNEKQEELDNNPSETESKLDKNQVEGEEKTNEQVENKEKDSSKAQEDENVEIIIDNNQNEQQNQEKVKIEEHQNVNS